MEIVTGDATDPSERPCVIAHVCNVQGGWGKGFVLALSKRWKAPERAYRNVKEYRLGTIQMVEVEEGLFVCNMMCQDGYRNSSNPVPLKYDHLETCLSKLNQWSVERGMAVAMPKIGSDLAGGNWETISEIIGRTITVPTTVYLLP